MNELNGRKTIIKHASALINSLYQKAKSLESLRHKLTEGELRELFVSDLLNHFLPSMFGIGNGIIINQKGEQSKQTDIIIYDTRIIHPFIKQQNIGIYPAECVLGTIEIKSRLREKKLLDAETSARHLYNVVYNPNSSIYKEYKDCLPLCGFLSLFGNGPKTVRDKEKGKIWLSNNIKVLKAIYLISKFSWIDFPQVGWTRGSATNQTFEETKRFLSIYLDNLRTFAEMRLKILTSSHKDYLGIYIRDKEYFK